MEAAAGLEKESKIETGEVKFGSNDGDSSHHEDIEIAMWRKFLDKAFEKRRNNCYDLEAYALSSYILDHNSDFHVIWNFRREILNHWKEHGTATEKASAELNFREYFAGYEDYELFYILDCVKACILSEELYFDKVLLNELSFTTKCLTKHLKSYATWFHRTMIVKMMQNPPIESELDACSDFFTLDPRNFHCWNYRKFICELQSADGFTTQLNFIGNMIKKHPDNFSAFHYRSVILQIAKEKGLMLVDQPFLDDEFNKIQETLTNLASHQGLWLYFWWLCFMNHDMLNLKSSESKFFVCRVILDNDNHNLIYQFNQCLRKQPFDELTIISDKGVSSSIKIKDWHSTGALTSDIWFHKINTNENIAEIIFTYSNKVYKVKMTNQPNQSKLIIRKINELPKNKFELIRETDALNKINELSDHSHKTNSQIVMEQNKYFNLTMALLYDVTYFDKLIQLDPLRRNYYLDSKSHHIICGKLKDQEEETNLNLENLSLTCLQPVSRLTHLRSLNLSNNQLTRINGSFNSLISLQSLILDNNQISFIDSSFKMYSLKTLSLKNNQLTEKSSLKPCNNCQQLELVIIIGNLITELEQADLELDKRITIQS